MFGTFLKQNRNGHKLFRLFAALNNLYMWRNPLRNEDGHHNNQITRNLVISLERNDRIKQSRQRYKENQFHIFMCHSATDAHEESKLNLMTMIITDSRS